MAHEEQDREDLLREATALIERVELALPGWSEHVVAGFRSDGCASLFFGPDPAYHFNTLRQLRRAYVNGLLYKTERGLLVSMRRERAANEVQLIRHDLDISETREFVAGLLARTVKLRQALERGNFRIIGQLPPDEDVPGRVKRWLIDLGEDVQIASSPRVG